MHRFKSAPQLQRFASIHGLATNLSIGCHYKRNTQQKRKARAQIITPRRGLRKIQTDSLRGERSDRSRHIPLPSGKELIE
jgi:hypothetical protein